MDGAFEAGFPERAAADEFKTQEDRAYRLRRLAAARGFLRAQIAAEIHRKRTPELVFELLGGIDEAGSVVDGEGEVI
jgi:ribosome-binding factor A